VSTPQTPVDPSQRNGRTAWTGRRPLRGSHRRRLGILCAVGCALAILAGVLVVPRLLHRGPPTACTDDPLAANAVAGLDKFARWLDRNNASGYIGEVGWPSGPDSARWNAVAETWYDAADAIGLPVTAWAAARWPSGYPMAVYGAGTRSTSLNKAGPQAKVVRGHPTTNRYLRGVVLAGGSFAAGDSKTGFNSTNRGRYGYDYSYESADSYAYLAREGVRLVRLTVVWERLQPVLGQPLDSAELANVRRALGYALQSRLAVIIDLHSYGEFIAGGPGGTRRLALGSAALPITALADFWSRMAEATRGEPAVIGYDVMNEPTNLVVRGAEGAQLWEKASQQAVDAIRHAGSDAVVAISGYGQNAPAQWGQVHPRPWINDPADRTVYEAHAYFDVDNSGRYAAGYVEELRRAQSIAHARCRTLVDLSGGSRNGLAGR